MTGTETSKVKFMRKKKEQEQKQGSVSQSLLNVEQRKFETGTREVIWKVSEIKRKWGTW